MQSVVLAKVLGLDGILEEQNGVVRRDQALAAGLTNNRIGDLVRRGRWEMVLPRVFAVGVSRQNPKVRIRATWLWAGDSSAIAGAAAAWWWNLTSNPPDSVMVIVPPPARRSPQTGVTVVRGALDSRDVEFEDWIRVTRVPRTCLDLARQADPDNLETALRLRQTDIPRLEQSLQRGRGRRGQVRARLAVSDVVDKPWSYSERIVHRHLKDAGITGWVANPPVRLRSGIRHPDIAIEDIKLAIEIDGREHHGSRQAFENDRARDNEFAEAGWTVLHFTWRQVTQGTELMIATIRATVDRLGTSGAPRNWRSSATPSGLLTVKTAIDPDSTAVE